MKVKAFLAALVVGGIFAGPVSAQATFRFFNGGGDGTWENPNNWVNGTTGNPGLPGVSDIADIGSTFTVSLSSGQSVSELQMARPASSGSYVPGTSTLNIHGTGNLQIGSSSGVRIGRALNAGDALGSSKGVVNQTGGMLQLTTGTNGLRLSQETGNVADSLYIISGGSVLGGPSPLQIGGNGNYNRAEFRVVGTGPTQIRFDDVRVNSNLGTGSGNREAVLHFVLDAGGVTPIVADDEFRITNTNGNNLLEISLIDLPPQADITLVRAARLTNSAPGLTYTPFTGMPDGTPIVREFGGWEYTWNLRYFEDDPNVATNQVMLQFVSATLIPEPSSLALLGLAGLGLFRRRR